MWHVNDSNISHRDIKVIKGVIKAIEEVYEKKIVTHSNRHDYVGMNFEYLQNKKAVRFCMKHHLEEVLQDFTDNITIKINTPTSIH